MILYRTNVTVSLPGGPLETYKSPYVTFFPPCNGDEEFISESRFLFYMNHVHQRRQVEIDDIQVRVTYKQLKINLWTDIWNMLKMIWVY